MRRSWVACAFVLAVAACSSGGASKDAAPAAASVIVRYSDGIRAALAHIGSCEAAAASAAGDGPIARAGVASGYNSGAAPLRQCKKVLAALAKSSEGLAADLGHVATPPEQMDLLGRTRIRARDAAAAAANYARCLQFVDLSDPASVTRAQDDQTIFQCHLRETISRAGPRLRDNLREWAIVAQLEPG